LLGLLQVKLDHNIGFREKREVFFAENWQKSEKIVIITSIPGWVNLGPMGECFLRAVLLKIADIAKSLGLICSTVKVCNVSVLTKKMA
jgi:hypothetical protein